MQRFSSFRAKPDPASDPNQIFLNGIKEKAAEQLQIKQRLDEQWDTLSVEEQHSIDGQIYFNQTVYHFRFINFMQRMIANYKSYPLESLNIIVTRIGKYEHLLRDLFLNRNGSFKEMLALKEDYSGANTIREKIITKLQLEKCNLQITIKELQLELIQTKILDTLTGTDSYFNLSLTSKPKINELLKHIDLLENLCLAYTTATTGYACEEEYLQAALSMLEDIYNSSTQGHLHIKHLSDQTSIAKDEFYRQKNQISIRKIESELVIKNIELETRAQEPTTATLAYLLKAKLLSLQYAKQLLRISRIQHRISQHQINIAKRDKKDPLIQMLQHQLAKDQALLLLCKISAHFVCGSMHCKLGLERFAKGNRRRYGKLCSDYRAFYTAFYADPNQTDFVLPEDLIREITKFNKLFTYPIVALDISLQACDIQARDQLSMLKPGC